MRERKADVESPTSDLGTVEERARALAVLAADGRGHVDPLDHFSSHYVILIIGVAAHVPFVEFNALGWEINEPTLCISPLLFLIYI